MRTTKEELPWLWHSSLNSMHVLKNHNHNKNNTKRAHSYLQHTAQLSGQTENSLGHAINASAAQQSCFPKQTHLFSTSAQVDSSLQKSCFRHGSIDKKTGKFFTLRNLPVTGSHWQRENYWCNMYCVTDRNKNISRASHTTCCSLPLWSF